MTENVENGREHTWLECMKSTQTVFAAATRWKHFPTGKGGNFNKKKNLELNQFKIVRTEPFKMASAPQRSVKKALKNTSFKLYFFPNSIHSHPPLLLTNTAEGITPPHINDDSPEQRFSLRWGWEGGGGGGWW